MTKISFRRPAAFVRSVFGIENVATGIMGIVLALVVIGGVQHTVKFVSKTFGFSQTIVVTPAPMPPVVDARGVKGRSGLLPPVGGVAAPASVAERLPMPKARPCTDIACVIATR